MFAAKPDLFRGPNLKERGRRSRLFEEFRLGRALNHATPRTVTQGDPALYLGHYPHVQRIADRQRGDGAVHRIADRAASGESKIDILKGRPDMAVLYRLRARRKLGSLTSDRRGIIKQFGLEATGTVGPARASAYAAPASWPRSTDGAARRDPRRGPRGPSRRPDRHMIELQPFGAMGGKQQQSPLATADVPAPVG